MRTKDDRTTGRQDAGQDPPPPPMSSPFIRTMEAGEAEEKVPTTLDARSLSPRKKTTPPPTLLPLSVSPDDMPMGSPPRPPSAPVVRKASRSPPPLLPQYASPGGLRKACRSPPPPRSSDSKLRKPASRSPPAPSLADPSADRDGSEPRDDWDAGGAPPTAPDIELRRLMRELDDSYDDRHEDDADHGASPCFSYFRRALRWPTIPK